MKTALSFRFITDIYGNPNMKGDHPPSDYVKQNESWSHVYEFMREFVMSWSHVYEFMREFVTSCDDIGNNKVERQYPFYMLYEIYLYQMWKLL